MELPSDMWRVIAEFSGAPEIIRVTIALGKTAMWKITRDGDGSDSDSNSDDDAAAGSELRAKIRVINEFKRRGYSLENSPYLGEQVAKLTSELGPTGLNVDEKLKSLDDSQKFWRDIAYIQYHTGFSTPRFLTNVERSGRWVYYVRACFQTYEQRVDDDDDYDCNSVESFHGTKLAPDDVWGWYQGNCNTKIEKWEGRSTCREPGCDHYEGYCSTYLFDCGGIDSVWYCANEDCEKINESYCENHTTCSKHDGCIKVWGYSDDEDEEFDY